MVLPTFPVVLSAVGACTVPAFSCDTKVLFLALQKWHLFFFFLPFLYLLVPNLPQLYMHRIVFSPSIL